METSPKRCLKSAAGEQTSKVLIKQEVEWLAEDSYAPDLKKELHMESLRSIKAEEDPYHADAGAHAVQEFTPLPQTDELIKAELILDEEIRDKLSGLEENCKQLVQPLADRKQELSCDLCQRTFSNKHSLSNHKRVHSKDRRTRLKASTFICEVCGSSFSSKRNLREHMLRKHLNKAQSNTQDARTADTAGVSEEEAAASHGQESAQAGISKSETKGEACEVCQCIFPTEYIRIHMRLAHSKQKYKCEICSRLFKDKYNLKAHLNTHATNRKRDFVCDICERAFYENSHLRDHKRRFAQRDHPKFDCEVCGSTFKRKGQLDLHMSTKHLEQSQPITPADQTAVHNSINSDQILSSKQTEGATFQCGVCSRIFKSKITLKRHFSTHHKDRKRYFACDGKREFPCDLCERKFRYKAVLNRHKKNHVMLKRPNFICEVCGSSHAQKATLKIHMLRKHLEKVQSKTSGPQTAKDDSIDTHTKEFLDAEAASYGPASQDSAALLSESNSYIKSEACEVCHCIFPTEYIRIHMRLAHSKQKYKCEICSRTFKVKCDFQRHLDTHASNRKRDFACDICGKTFYTKRNLCTHKKVHTQDTYQCKVCGKRFTQVKSLKVHLLRRQHFDETQQFTPQPSNDADVPMKTELTSDEEEEFIDEGKNRNSLCHAEESQQSALPADDEHRRGKDSVSCEVCHNSYPAELIETHMRINHGDGSCKCQFCPLICLCKAELERHIKIHDGKDKRTGSHACEQCGLKFHSARYVKLHMIRKHTKNRIPKFNCELCEKKFYTKTGLEQHQRTHTDDAISCGVCGARFTKEEGLKYHMLHKHTPKTQQCTPDPATANDDSVHTKEELVSDEEFLDEET